MINMKTFDELTNLELLQLMRLRQEVFIEEQKICEVDIDDFDLECRHLFIKDNGKIVSYLRLLKYKGDDYIGRVVTDINYRNKGYSTKIFNFLKERYDVLTLSAQLSKVDFYKKIGFKVVGKKYLEAGIEHMKMVYIK